MRPVVRSFGDELGSSVTKGTLVWKQRYAVDGPGYRYRDSVLNQWARVKAPEDVSGIWGLRRHNPCLTGEVRSSKRQGFGSRQTFLEGAL